MGKEGRTKIVNILSMIPEEAAPVTRATYLEEYLEGLGAFRFFFKY